MVGQVLISYLVHTMDVFGIIVIFGVRVKWWYVLIIGFYITSDYYYKQIFLIIYLNIDYLISYYCGNLGEWVSGSFLV